MIFSHQINNPIGLDISDSSLKVIQLANKGSNIYLQAFGSKILKPGIVKDGRIIRVDKFSEAMKDLIDNPQYGKINTNRIIACLPETQTFVKLIKIFKSPNNIEDVIENEIQKHIPFSLKDLYFDWQLIEEDNNEMTILIGAAPKNIVNQYIDLFRENNFFIEALELEPISICRSLLLEESPTYEGLFKKNYIIIDLGATRTSVIFYSHNTIIFSMSLPFSGQDITADIMEAHKLSKALAEKKKHSIDYKKNKKSEKIFSDFSKQINLKIKELRDYFNNNYSERGSLDCIIVCGGGACSEYLNNEIKNEQGIDFKKGNVLSNISADNKKIFQEVFKKNKRASVKSDKMVEENYGLEYATAMGLALRNIFIKEF